MSVPGPTAGLPAALQQGVAEWGRTIAVVQVVIRPAPRLLRLQKLGDVQFLTLLGLCAAPGRRRSCEARGGYQLSAPTLRRLAHAHTSAA